MAALNASQDALVFYFPEWKLVLFVKTELKQALMRLVNCYYEVETLRWVIGTMRKPTEIPSLTDGYALEISSESITTGIFSEIFLTF